MKKIYSCCLIVVALLVVLSGCAKPPETELKAAKDAIAAAQSAEAELYAKVALRSAIDTLAAAEKLMKEQDGKSSLFRDYKKVQAMFVIAGNLAKKASTEAIATNTEKITKLLSNARTALDNANADLKKVVVNKQNETAINTIKADLAFSESFYAAAKTDIGANKFSDAKTKIKGVITMADFTPFRISTAVKGLAKPGKGNKKAGYVVEITSKLSFDKTVDTLLTMLAAEGFSVGAKSAGVDMAMSVRSKLGVDFSPYIVLHLCDPLFAYMMLKTDPGVGVLLPCTIVVWERGDYRTVFAMEQLFLNEMIGDPVVSEVGRGVSKRLHRVLDAVAAIK